MTHEKEFEHNMNSPENKELTQKQAEAANNPEKGKESEHQAVQNVAEAAETDNKLSAEQQAQKENALHEGHIMPDRLNFNQYDNTDDKYDKAKGTPADPELKNSASGDIVDREGTVSDVGYDAKNDNEQASVGNVNQKDNYSSGNPEEEEKSMKTQDEKKNDSK